MMISKIFLPDECFCNIILSNDMFIDAGGKIRKDGDNEGIDVLRVRKGECDDKQRNIFSESKGIKRV